MTEPRLGTYTNLSPVCFISTSGRTIPMTIGSSQAVPTKHTGRLGRGVLLCAMRYWALTPPWPSPKWQWPGLNESGTGQTTRRAFL
jgi:hypothetical protein